MVAVPRLHEMKYSETRQSVKIIEPTKHWKTDSYYRQINVIRSKLIWTSWRPRFKIWAYGLKFLDVFTPKRPLLKTLVISKYINQHQYCCRQHALDAVSYRLRLKPEVVWPLYRFRTEIHSRIVPPRRL